MSTLALQLDQTLNQLDAAKRAEMEFLVRATIDLFAQEAGKPGRTLEEKHARFVAAAGSLPDFPEDYEESPWETDRDPFP
ncbi:MAG: hypothetical protein JWL81_1514 [Verrucomicrobiales bacterium]|nr:hypothetical protein [Verrucomicrobiales bacterium]